MVNSTFNKAINFIYRNARPLDIARWQYHFENGSREAVLTALAAYQNEDGGFGHALEPDAWNPHSAPIQTWVAMEILREIGFTDSSHPIMQGILTYLASGQEFAGKYWFNTISSNKHFPHASWWHNESEDSGNDNYNPTAYLAGFIIRFADKDSDLFKLGQRIAKEAFDAYMASDFTHVADGLLGDMHIALCYVRLLEYTEEADVANIFDVSELKAKLRKQVKHSITQNTAEWETGYICKPSQFFNSCDSIFYADNKEIADYECEYIIKTQFDDGSWNIPWGWADYSEEWAVTKNWWKGNGSILNMLYLKGMGKL